MDNIKTLYEITYTLSIDDYLNYNKIVYSEMLHRNRKKTTIFGVLTSLLGGFVLSTFLFTSEFSLLFIILDILLLAIGIGSILYYPLIFPKILKKTVVKNYKRHDMAYLKYSLKFSEEYVVQETDGKESFKNIYRWDEFKHLFVFDNYIILMFLEPIGIYVPSRKIDVDYDAKLKSFIIHKAEENEMKILYEK